MTTNFTTSLSTKFAALSVAVAINAMMLGSVAYLFNGQLHPASLTALAHSAVTVVDQAKI